MHLNHYYELFFNNDLTTRLPTIKQNYTEATSDAAGNLLIGNKTNFPWVIVVSVSLQSGRKLIVKDFYLNEYDLWYARLVDLNGTAVANKLCYLMFISADQ